MLDKIHCFNFSFNGYLLSSALTIIFLMEMFKTPRNLLRNCKWTLWTSVWSQVEKWYPLYGFQTLLPHKRIGKIEALFVPFRSGPKCGTERGCVHTGTEKNHEVRSKTGPESEPEIGTIRYRTVLVWTEKQVQFRSSFRTCLVSTGDTKLISMTTSNDQVEIRPNCTSLICWLFRLFKTDHWLPPPIHILFLCVHVMKFLNFVLVFGNF